MRVRVILLGIVCMMGILQAEESFLTNEEYARMLYQNPRGISCAKCHGPHGEGGVISRYIEKGALRTITAPPIVDLPMRRFKKALRRRKGLMPEYFLTDVEMAYLYYYLLGQKKPGHAAGTKSDKTKPREKGNHDS